MADKTCNTCKANKICDHNKFGFENCGNYIPLAVTEVKRGKWISASAKANVGMKCNVCGARIKYSEFFNGNHNYCHKCGADMRQLDKH